MAELPASLRGSTSSLMGPSQGHRSTILVRLAWCQVMRHGQSQGGKMPITLMRTILVLQVSLLARFQAGSMHTTLGTDDSTFSTIGRKLFILHYCVRLLSTLRKNCKISLTIRSGKALWNPPCLLKWPECLYVQSVVFAAHLSAVTQDMPMPSSVIVALSDTDEAPSRDAPFIRCFAPLCLPPSPLLGCWRKCSSAPAQWFTSRAQRSNT